MVPLPTFKEKYFWHHLLQYLKKVTLLGLWACDTFLAFKLGQYSALIPVFYILFIVLNFYKITKICFRDFFNLSSYFFLSKIFKWRSLEPFSKSERFYSERKIAFSSALRFVSCVLLQMFFLLFLIFLKRYTFINCKSNNIYCVMLRWTVMLLLCFTSIILGLKWKKSRWLT